MMNIYPARKSFSMLDPFEDFANSFSVNRWSMNSDVHDLGNAYELAIELPGYKKEDIKLELDHDSLIVKAERKLEKTEDETCIRRERFYGSVSRSFDVSGVDTTKIEAKYEDGILSVTLPKKEELAARTIEIK